ncbi:MAG: hypothetical protein U0736_04255 [Gemmataceae bacterium]
MPRRPWLTLLAGLLATCGPLHAADAIDFDRQVRPLLRERCVACHGGEAKGGLRLDARGARVPGRRQRRGDRTRARRARARCSAA